MGDKESKDSGLTRREAIIAATSGLLVAALPVTQAEAQAVKQAAKAPKAGSSPGKKKNVYTFLNKNEAAFIEAAVARLIPADDQWGGAIEADVPNYFDKQLGGSWGAGERLYRSGPWKQGKPTQGYQLPYTPAELFRTALKAIDTQLKKTPFAKMSAADQDAYLHKLEKEDFDLGGVPSKVFFGSLWQLTMEGFFADPVYGGNRDMLSWRMIGFPGAYGSYYDIVDKHGIKIDRAPISLAEDAAGMIHQHPNIPAKQ
jgi:gluconate 2-dehydrogenase gamma chain